MLYYHWQTAMQEQHIVNSDGQCKCKDNVKMSAHRISGQRSIWLVAAAVLVMAALTACGSVHLPGERKTYQNDGGLRITFSLSCPASQAGCDIQRLSAQTRDILQQRATEGLGVAGAVTRLNGDMTIVVELPGYTNDTRALAVLGSRGELDFIDISGTPPAIGTNVSTQLCVTSCTHDQYPIRFTGAQLDLNALNASLDPQSNQPVITFAFAQPYQQQFAEYTRQHIGQYLTITLDGTVIESATIQSEIDSQGEITGIGNMDNAQVLVAKLKSHPLPLVVTVTSEETALPSH